MASSVADTTIRHVLPGGQRLLDSGARIGLALVVGFVVQRLLFLVVGRVESLIVRAGQGHAHAQQRARTIGQIFRNICTVLVAGVVILHSLTVLGWNVAPLLAGAGILGVALGFGAQTLVRDVIAGIFILVEDQFAVGDLIEVSGRAATVEDLTVRSTTLRDFNGNLHFVPNGEMKIVINRSRGWTRLAVDVPIVAGEDVERALDVCEKVATAMNNDAAWRSRLLDPIQVWGVEGLTSTEAVVRLVVRAKPGLDAPEAARELRRQIVRDLATAGVRTSAGHEVSIRPVSASATSTESKNAPAEPGPPSQAESGPPSEAEPTPPPTEPS